MAYLDNSGLTTLANNINTKFAKKSENKLYVATTAPTTASDNSLLVNPDELLTETEAGTAKVKSLNSLSGNNISMDNYLKRNTSYSVGDTAMSMKLPGLYYLECTSAGTTGSTENISYAPPLNSVSGT